MNLISATLYNRVENPAVGAAKLAAVIVLQQRKLRERFDRNCAERSSSEVAVVIRAFDIEPIPGRARSSDARSGALTQPARRRNASAQQTQIQESASRSR